VVVSIITVTVPVATLSGKTVEIAGSLITVGTALIVTVVKKVGTGVLHELAGTEIMLELGK
jgi:DNA helicase TIP49 (TBP-interacting protein)